jgi:hypothetical protein
VANPTTSSRTVRYTQRWLGSLPGLTICLSQVAAATSAQMSATRTWMYSHAFPWINRLWRRSHQALYLSLPPYARMISLRLILVRPGAGYLSLQTAAPRRLCRPDKEAAPARNRRRSISYSLLRAIVS